MESYLEFLAEKEAPEGTVLHIHNIEHPRGKAKLIVAYHKSASAEKDGRSRYVPSVVKELATEHPEGFSADHAIGFVAFRKVKGATHRALNLYVDHDWTRKGVATAMYDHAKGEGLKPIPSKDQSGNGAAFWKGYRRHLRNS
jgi:GNAT superfamily N-acetyltransferase